MKILFIYFKAYIQNNVINLLWIFIFSCFTFLIFASMMRKRNKEHNAYTASSYIYRMLLSFQCAFVFVMTLFNRERVDGNTFIFKVIASYIEAFRKQCPEVFLQIIMNILMFVPIGFLLPCCFKVFQKYRYVLLITFVCSLVIELCQGIFRIGYFESVDIIHNIAGAMIGGVLHMSSLKLKKYV